MVGRPNKGIEGHFGLAIERSRPDPTPNAVHAQADAAAKGHRPHAARVGLGKPRRQSIAIATAVAVTSGKVTARQSHLPHPSRDLGNSAPGAENASKGHGSMIRGRMMVFARVYPTTRETVLVRVLGVEVTGNRIIPQMRCGRGFEGLRRHWWALISRRSKANGEEIASFRCDQ